MNRWQKFFTILALLGFLSVSGLYLYRPKPDCGPDSPLQLIRLARGQCEQPFVQHLPVWWVMIGVSYAALFFMARGRKQNQ